ncbi:hypothetical protein BD626DRAFT_163861 [Schizophyllum amplum]|uniref:TauD/TfdA-like domain-containing protein n=1 Tax=Schizophyllum amplum TaxID=97359 RepID=A0A550CPP8_9AGAR|nr:hypothetical protein BD626DRAFT_163861 [Auriculariopsis ampla]
MVAAPNDLAGSLSGYEHIDLTPHIGTQFTSKTVQLSEILKAPNADEQIRDLARLVSHRGVVFFTDQDIEISEQKVLGQRLGELTGKPKTSGLHLHPISEVTSELGGEVSVIDSKMGIARAGLGKEKERASKGWHADITFENIPSDYALLKMHTLPKVGGDTLWASAYEAYDRLSPAYRRFLEGLTAVHNADFFNEYARVHGLAINELRGSPENVGSDLTAIHPVIRTNPVTGFKGLYVNPNFTRRIVELSKDESDDVLAFLARHVSENHDMHVRFRWGKNDLAIWDNRSTFHTATNDYNNDDKRQGNRVVSLGERPYLDPNSKSRRDALDIHW